MSLLPIAFRIVRARDIDTASGAAKDFESSPALRGPTGDTKGIGMRQNKEEAKRIGELARAHRFKNFSDAEIAQVVDAAVYHTVPDGWAIIAESTPADKAYLILSGTVSIRRHGEEIAQAGAGDIVGEMALVDHKLRSATVVALTPLEVLNFTSAIVDELAAEIPHFREALTTASEERHH